MVKSNTFGTIYKLLCEYDLLFFMSHFQHQPDLAIGVHLMDRYTFYLLEFLEDIHPASKTSMNDLVRVLAYTPFPSYLILAGGCR